MKTKFIYLLFFVTVLLFTDCSDDTKSAITDSGEILRPDYPENIQEFGEIFASNLSCVANKLAQDDNLKSTVNSINTEEVQNYQEEFFSIVSEFSEEKLEILHLIVNARLECTSFEALSSRLTSINEKIYNNFVNQDQEELLYLTSAIYYGFREIENLINSGILTGAEARIADFYMGTNSLKSTKEILPLPMLEYIWSLAILEPTFVGEAFAAIFTIYFGSYFLITRAECIEKYVDCKRFTPYKDCGTCLNYCIVQNDWNCN